MVERFYLSNHLQYVRNLSILRSSEFCKNLISNNSPKCVFIRIVHNRQNIILYKRKIHAQHSIFILNYKRTFCVSETWAELEGSPLKAK